MEILIRALLGASIVVLISVFSKTKNFFLAGMVPLFPTFALIAHYIIGKERSVIDLKKTILFSMLSMIPYFAYLVTLYFSVDVLSVNRSLVLGVAVWIVVASIQIYCWKGYVS